MTRHRFACPLRWSDMDAQGHVYNGAYLDYLQEARVNVFTGAPPPLGRMLDTGVLVVGHQVEYLAPVMVTGADPLLVELWVDSVGAARFAVSYAATHRDVPVLRARTTLVPYEVAAGALRRLAPEERTQLAAGVEPAVELRAAPASAPPLAGRGHRFPVSVRWSDLDSYGHVNNVTYVDYLAEARIALFREVGTGGRRGAVWAVARQDIDYRAPLDLRRTPYEVVTAVTASGRRSVTLAAEIADPGTGRVHATARAVVVLPQPLSEDQRSALSRFAR